MHNSNVHYSQSKLAKVCTTAMYTTASPNLPQYARQQCTLQPVHTHHSTHNTNVHYSQSTLSSTHDSNVQYNQSILTTVCTTAMYTTASLYSPQYTQYQRTLQPVHNLHRTHDSHVHYSQSTLSTVHTTAMYTTASLYPQ